METQEDKQWMSDLASRLTDIHHTLKYSGDARVFITLARVGMEAPEDARAAALSEMDQIQEQLASAIVELRDRWARP